MLVTENKILGIIQRGPPEGMSNIDISREIYSEHEDETNLVSVKVLVSRKTRKLLEKGELERFGRRFNITRKGQLRISKGSFARTSYDVNSRVLNNISVSLALPPDRSGKIIYEDREIQEALSKLDEALKNEDDFSLIIKKREKNEDTES